jgi:hypothetical protein
MCTLKCPSCESDIDFISFFKSASPFHMKCGKCGIKLKQDKFGWVCLILAFFSGALLAVMSARLGFMFSSALVGFSAFFTGLLLIELLGFKLIPRLGVKLKAKNA